ncbi:hypothetical protein FQZ97_1124040 [compost metagenome]
MAFGIAALFLAFRVAVGAGGAAVGLAVSDQGVGVHHTGTTGAGAAVVSHGRILCRKNPMAVLGVRMKRLPGSLCGVFR